MYIGEVIKRTGATRSAVRYFETLGLLGEVAIPGRYRVYSEEQVRLIRVILYARQVGVRLADLSEVARSEAAIPAWEGILSLVERQEQALKKQVESLQRDQARLRAYRVKVDECLSSLAS